MYTSVQQRIDAETAKMEVGDLIHTMIKEYAKQDYSDNHTAQSYAYFAACERLNEMFKLPETEPDTLRMLNDGEV